MIRTTNLLTNAANTLCFAGFAFMLACNALPDPWRTSMMDAAVWNLVAAGSLYVAALIAAVLSLFKGRNRDRSGHVTTHAI